MHVYLVISTLLIRFYSKWILLQVWMICWYQRWHHVTEIYAHQNEPKTPFTPSFPPTPIQLPTPLGKSSAQRSLPPKGDKTHGEAEAQQTFPPRQGTQKKHGALQLGWLRMDEILHSSLGSLWRFIIASRLWNSASVAIWDVGWMRLVKIVIVPQKGVHWQHHHLEATAPSNAHVALEVAMHLKLVNVGPGGLLDVAKIPMLFQIWLCSMSITYVWCINIYVWLLYDM